MANLSTFVTCAARIAMLPWWKGFSTNVGVKCPFWPASCVVGHATFDTHRSGVKLKMLRILSYICLFMLLFCSIESRAQSIATDNTVALIRANYLYQFASNINWPAEQKKGKFIIGVYGNDELAEVIRSKYASKPVGSQILDVAVLTEITPATNVQILFIDKVKKSDISKIVRDMKGKSTLLISNYDGALGQGLHINFKNIDGSIRYELNKDAMIAQQITPGIKIMQWATQ
jgi:hypothetical protein